jgi:hypothetical protein
MKNESRSAALTLNNVTKPSMKKSSVKSEPETIESCTDIKLKRTRLKNSPKNEAKPIKTNNTNDVSFEYMPVEERSVLLKSEAPGALKKPKKGT